MLTDTIHRLMTLEACQAFGWPYAGIARQLRRHPDEIRRLRRSRQAIDDMIAIGLAVLPVNLQDVMTACD